MWLWSLLVTVLLLDIGCEAKPLKRVEALAERTYFYVGGR